MEGGGEVWGGGGGVIWGGGRRRGVFVICRGGSKGGC